MSKKEGVIPAGSRGPEEEMAVEEGTPPVEEGTPPVEEGTPPVEEGTPPAEEGTPPVGGRFKSMQEAEEAVANLEQVLGRQGQELGNLRETTQQMMNALASRDSLPSQEQQQSPDFNAQLGTLMEQVNEGDIDFGDALMQAVTMVRDETSKEVEARTAKQFQEYDQKRSANQVYQDFLKENPDYEEVVNSGVLDKIGGPMDDNYSKFVKFKAAEAEKAAYEKGKAEAAALAKGTEQTRKVLNKPGASIQQTNPQKGPVKSRAELNERLTTALRRARGDAEA